MRPCSGLTLIGPMLVLAAPAAAQEAPARSAEYRHDPPPSEAAPSRQKRVELGPSLSLGVGLFSVVGQSEKETVRRRTDPTPAVRPKDRKMGAVGFSLRF